MCLKVYYVCKRFILVIMESALAVFCTLQTFLFAGIILVLMEYALGEPSVEVTIVGDGLNPCSNGICSRSY